MNNTHRLITEIGRHDMVGRIESLLSVATKYRRRLMNVETYCQRDQWYHFRMLKVPTVKPAISPNMLEVKGE